MSFLKKFKKMGIVFQDMIYFLLGVVYYQFFRNTPSKSYLAMIRLHSITGGRSTDFFCWVIRIFFRDTPPKKLNFSPVFLKERNSEEINEIINTLKQEGCYIFDEKLPEELVDYLFDFSLKVPCALCDSQVASDEVEKEYFNPDSPIAVKYSIPTESLLNDQVVQSLLLDKTLIEITSCYLNDLPKLDICTMWWSAAVKNKPSVEAAQMYHFDMDRFKWLKLFVYLVDVNENNGPHVFVKKTHQYDKRQNHLLKKNYVRLHDNEVEPIFHKEVTSILGKRGTIFLADTRALHKGLLPLVGNRLIFQLEFTSCMFGGEYAEIENVKIHHPILRELLLKYPKMMPLIKSYQL